MGFYSFRKKQDKSSNEIKQETPVRAQQAETYKENQSNVQYSLLLFGVPASPGIASGQVKVVSDSSQIDKVKAGDIMVVETTTPDFVPAMKRAAAIVTDLGGRTCSTAIISRELWIPCITGTERATSILKDGQVITVDGTRGKVYDGKFEIKTTAASDSKEHIKTKTRVYVNLAEPELAEKIAARNVDGVGLLRAEFIVAQIGEHPRYMISQGRGKGFTEKLASGIQIFAKIFNPRPVVYRMTDFKTNEYHELKGGAAYEGSEENPMLGYHGASRYITDIDVFRLELDAIKQVRQTYKNLWVMIPFVRTIKELTDVKNLMENEGLKRSADFKLWMMTEIPSNVILIDKFLNVGIDGISIGSNDLTQLTLGVDRDNEKLAAVFDERDEAVMASLERLVTVAKKMGVTCSICGHEPSVYPEITEKLVEWGITSVSVSPNMIGVTREIISKAEEKLALANHNPMAKLEAISSEVKIMSLFKSKPKMNINECCKQFYESNIFHATIAGTNVWSMFLDIAFKSIAEVDQSFLSVDSTLFRNEMTALRMELFALAWAKRFKGNKYAFPQSIFTKRYLEENGSLNIWNIMSEYNHAIARSATTNAKGETTPGRTGRAQVNFINLMRVNAANDWLKTNVVNVDAMTTEEENNTECITRSISRFGADINHEKGIVIRLLSSRLAVRLGCDISLKYEAFSRLASIIVGFYNGAEEYLKSVDLHG